MLDRLTSPKNKDSTVPKQQLSEKLEEISEKLEEIVFFINSKKIILCSKFMLGYGIYIAITCCHKLAAFF